ncbi:MAG: hypothetical protein HC898_03315 [Phycisphaerales bacterium]|nr:hypothetical protein [Phycisphaerales bacterium]
MSSGAANGDAEANPWWSPGAMVQTVVALALVLGLIFVLRWLMRQWSGIGAAVGGGSGGQWWKCWHAPPSPPSFTF